MRSYVLSYAERGRMHDRAYRAQQRGHREVAGALFADKRGRLRLCFLRNLSNAPYHYEIAKWDIRTVRKLLERDGVRYVGTFHSHPVGYAELSASDLERGTLRTLQLVYDVCGREAKLWRIVKKGGRRIAREVPLGIEPRPRPNRCLETNKQKNTQIERKALKPLTLPYKD